LRSARVFPRLLRERAEQYRIATVGNEHEHKYAGDGKNEGLAAAETYQNDVQIKQTYFI
jgi:hypothetical protein